MTGITAHITATVIEISSTSQFDQLIKNPKPTVVKFYANWCGPCKSFAPKFKQVADGELTNKVTFIAINIDNFKDLANRYEVRSLPSVLYFQNGTQKSKLSGALSIGGLTAKIKSIFGV